MKIKIKLKSFNFFKLIFSLIFLFFPIALLTGCSSINNENYSMKWIPEETKYEYNNATSTTKITWHGYLKNETIYSVEKFWVTFDLYQNNKKIKDDLKIYYDYEIPPGKAKDQYFSFIFDDKIDKINSTNYSFKLNSFFMTYEPWIITTIVLIIVLSISYLIAMLVDDWDLDDFWEDFPGISWSILISLLVIAGLSFIYSWMSGCIMLAIPICTEIMILIMHLGKSLIESFFSIELKLNIKKFKKPNKTKTTSTDTKNNIVKKTKNTIKFKDVIGLEKAKETFNEKIILPFKHPEIYKEFNKKMGGGILLYGPPGTGKTMFAQAASNEIDAMFIPIKSSDIKSKWYGESENKISKLFKDARKHKKAVIFFDEFESIGSKRTDSNENMNNDLVPQILTEMQGFDNSNSNNSIVVIAATNRPWAIDPAFLRPGHFDEKIYVGLPNYEARKLIFENNLKNITVNKDLDFNELAKISEGYNCADISNVCEKLKMFAIKQTLKNKNKYLLSSNDAKLTIKNQHSTVSKADLERFKEFEKEYK